jgi:hypothetical protein
MKATDLRIGNLVNYEISEGDVLPNVIDWQDLKWLSEDEQGFNLFHNPIPLTEEWLMKFGFVKGKFDNYVLVLDNEFSKISYWSNSKKIELSNTRETTWGAVNCMYLHQLQNLYFALTGTELIQK